MAALLRELGKDVRIINGDSTPPRLAFVDPQRRIEVLGQGVGASELEWCDVIIVLDTSAWRQLGSMAEAIRGSSRPVVVIDHHASDGELPALSLKDAEVEATGRLVYDLARFLGCPLTCEMADALFAAIATDTGWFRFPSTTGSTYRVAAELVEAGARPAEIFRQLYERDSVGRAKLRGLVLTRLVTELAGRLAHTHVRAEDFANPGAVPSETEDFVNMALAIDGTDVAVMLTEQPAGTVKVSLRSRAVVDCSRLTAAWGGGGHKAAAGATLTGPFEVVQLQVLEAVRNAIR
jgi:phosphoesterase RecJ-like protein